MNNAYLHVYLQEAIMSPGYQSARFSILEEANPTIGDNLPGAAVRKMYALLDGHHRVAALRALQVSGALASDHSIPVIILK